MPAVRSHRRDRLPRRNTCAAAATLQPPRTRSSIMKRHLTLSVLSLFLIGASGARIGGQPQAPAIIMRAAEALGGAARLRAVRNITVAGYGEAAYMNGGGNISASRDAPQKWVSIPEY